MTTAHAHAQPRRILVFRALFLGDLLCAVPALDALDARFPDAQITMVGLPWASELAERLPAIDRFEPFPGYPGLAEVTVDVARTDAFLARIRAERYDLALQMHGSGGVTNELVATMGAARTCGYGPPGDRRLDVVLPWEEGEHEVRRWLRLVAALGATDSATGIDIPIPEAARWEADRLLGGPALATGPLVGLHVGAKDAARRWPADRFAALGDALSALHGARLVLTGGPGERDLATEVRGLMRANAIDLVGKTDLGALFAVVDRLDLLVTNDTGASHVAVATRTPSVVLFGPTLPSRWAPLDCQLHEVVDASALVGADVDRDDALARLPMEPVLAACGRALARVTGVGAGSPRASDSGETP